MNPSNPTIAELQHIEVVFLRQMQMLSRRASSADPSRSLDYQCSDAWL